MRLALLVAVAVILPTAEARANCYEACVAERPIESQDHFVHADRARKCRDLCEGKALSRLKTAGLYGAYAACTPQPLPLEDFRTTRAGSSSWRQEFNVFSWTVKNDFADKILTGIDVSTQDLSLSRVSISAESVIAPGDTGTFVIPDFFDGYPAVRYATKVETIYACSLTQEEPAKPSGGAGSE
ncbi:hypothetical protein HDIA_2329 [Hartmannibacter diazotrophicus]|uniref:Uncharacterized protein n=1 Tax=Hartmannibacter diazotrophicus TaxID=1482074 RepID=A0A2C9D6Q1_9HYPH|nr:hypothetical protein [Hartmannibacter diazotrophicus]SON55870.1 hypothetical protein HDIA_2329 [Hartmannibacter diazotrophicus]